MRSSVRASFGGRIFSAANCWLRLVADQEDRAHAALAQRRQDAERPDDHALADAAKELAGLEARQLARPHQVVGQRPGILRDSRAVHCAAPLQHAARGRAGRCAHDRGEILRGRRPSGNQRCDRTCPTSPDERRLAPVDRRTEGRPCQYTPLRHPVRESAPSARGASLPSMLL